jgi:SAM-dependent methyltransferase
MHPRVFEAFETICAPLRVTGRVLEIGASPGHRPLLEMAALRTAAERVGVGLDGAAETAGYRIVVANAHDLSRFADGWFELVVCNSVLEHDPRFWLTVVEARRVTAPGGWMVFGAPAFGAMDSVPGARTIKRLARLPFVGARWSGARNALQASSATLGLHDFPGDYYRFSEQAMADVVLADLESVTTRLILEPPRVIGAGRKPRP